MTPLSRGPAHFGVLIFVLFISKRASVGIQVKFSFSPIHENN